MSFDPNLIFTAQLSNSLAAAVPGPVKATGTSGADIIEGSNLADNLSGGAGDDILNGYDGDDVLLGGAGNDTLDGGNGDDVLDDRDGNNQMLGGAGNDFLFGSLMPPSSFSGQALSTGLLDGGEGNDALSGYNGYHFAGGAGDDRIAVTVSNSTASDTTVSGGSGADRFEFQFEAQAKGRLTISGGVGTDTYVLSGLSALPTLDAQLRVTDFAAGAGGDVIDLAMMLPFNYSGNPFTSGLLRLSTELNDTLLQVRVNTTYYTVLLLSGVRPSQLTASNFSGGIDPNGGNNGLVLSGSSLDDILIGDQLNDKLSGNGGNDMLNGLGGDDRLDGGSGDDGLEGGEGNDILLGGDGNDYLSDSSSAGNNELYGGAGDDILRAYSAGNNLLDGGAGNDQLFGYNDFDPAIGQYTLRGGLGDDFLTAYAGAILEGNEGDDILASLNGGGRLDGGTGIDSAHYAGASTDYTVRRTANGFVVSTNLDIDFGSDQLTNIERLEFSDTSVALDVEGMAGQAFRIYRAAFDRAPDSSGMGFWLARMDSGQSLVEIASGFAASKEFRELYGSAPTNAELVTRMYTNILHRDPEPGGYAFWLDVLDTKKADLATVLASISESAENQAAVAELIANGIAYTPYAG